MATFANVPAVKSSPFPPVGPSCIHEEALELYVLRRTTEKQSEMIEGHLLFCRRCQQETLRSERLVLFFRKILCRRSLSTAA